MTDLTSLPGQRLAALTEALAATASLMHAVGRGEVTAARAQAWRLASAVPLLTQVLGEGEVAPGAQVWLPDLSLQLRVALRLDAPTFLARVTDLTHLLDQRLGVFWRALGFTADAPEPRERPLPITRSGRRPPEAKTAAGRSGQAN